MAGKQRVWWAVLPMIGLLAWAAVFLAPKSPPPIPTIDNYIYWSVPDMFTLSEAIMLAPEGTNIWIKHGTYVLESTNGTTE